MLNQTFFLQFILVILLYYLIKFFFIISYNRNVYQYNSAQSLVLNVEVAFIHVRQLKLFDKHLNAIK